MMKMMQPAVKAWSDTVFVGIEITNEMSLAGADSEQEQNLLERQEDSLSGLYGGYCRFRQ
jgi:hypothetical protein